MLWAARARRMNTYQTVGAALICSGGLGNLIDRLTHGGYVTDFLNVAVVVDRFSVPWEIRPPSMTERLLALCVWHC